MIDKKNDNQDEAVQRRKEKRKAYELKKKLEKEKKEKLKKRIIAEILIGCFLLLCILGYKGGLFSNANLIEAVQKNYTVRVSLILLTKQASTGEINDALVEAIQRNKLGMVKKLVKAGANVNYWGNDTFDNPLLSAADFNNVEIAKYLLDKGADGHIILPQNPVTPLSSALRRGNLEVARLLIEREKEIDFKDTIGDTALMYAVESEKFNKEICELLLSKGADINATDGNGGSTILINITNSIENHEDKARFLLDHGANVNASNSVGTTPLLQAASVGNLNLVKLYIERGADIFVINTWNQSALDLATMMEPHNEVIAYLNEKGL